MACTCSVSEVYVLWTWPWDMVSLGGDGALRRKGPPRKKLEHQRSKKILWTGRVGKDRPFQAIIICQVLRLDHPRSLFLWSTSHMLLFLFSTFFFLCSTAGLCCAFSPTPGLESETLLLKTPGTSAKARSGGLQLELTLKTPP